jgi:ADP-ribose pyrophosphatase YjhB (NUDIX family)
VCVGAVVVHDDDLLLIRRGHDPGAGEWAVPGGRVEPGELLMEAVVRELAEETGLEATCGELLGWVERIEGDDHFVILDFSATVLERIEPRPGDDASEARWVPLHEVADYALVDGLAEFLHEHGVLRTIT